MTNPAHDALAELKRADANGQLSEATYNAMVGAYQASQSGAHGVDQGGGQAANIPGLALGVVYGSPVVYLKGYGIAGPDGRAVTAQTSFILGSTAKSSTALAIMQLVEHTSPHPTCTTSPPQLHFP